MPGMLRRIHFPKVGFFSFFHYSKQHDQDSLVNQVSTHARPSRVDPDKVLELLICSFTIVRRPCMVRLRSCMTRLHWFPYRRRIL